MTRRLAAAAPFGAAVLWGGLYVVSKWAFGAVAPFTLAFVRVALGALALLALVGVRRDLVAEWRTLLALGGWVALSIATQFLGTDLTTASQGALLTILSPVFAVVLAAAVLDEPLTADRTLGVALAVAGTVVVLAGQYDLSSVGTGNAVGVGALVVAGLTWAAFTVQGAPLVRRYGALTTAAYGTVASVPLLGLLALAEAATATGPVVTDASLPVVAAVAYLGFAATAGAWYLWYKGLEVVDTATVAVSFFAQPVVATALGTALLDEAIGIHFVLGGAVMGVGILVVNHARSAPDRV